MIINAIVTDIEGTTTDIAFVKDVLFPYAFEQLPDYVRQHVTDPDVAAQLDATRQEMGQPQADLEVVITQLLYWIDTDEKVTPLKTLQGMLWSHGYKNGDFTAHLYADVAPALHQWAAEGKALYVYSSGSVQAQKLLFAHTPVGDLTPLFRGYFDTRMGHKRDADAYRNIAQVIALPAEQILFLSDVAEELDAARSAGWRTLQLVRPGTEPCAGHLTVQAFNEIAF